MLNPPDRSFVLYIVQQTGDHKFKRMVQKMADARPFSAPSHDFINEHATRIAYDAMKATLIEKIQSDPVFASAIANDLNGMLVMTSPHANLKNMAQSIYEAAVAQVASNAAENAMQDIFKDIGN